MMVDEHGFLKKELGRDNLPPNAQGKAVMARLAKQGIQDALKAH